MEGKKTNHSGRKTMLTQLVQQDVPHLNIAQLSGHKNLKSIESYSFPSEKQQKNMSHKISGKQWPLSDTTNFHSNLLAQHLVHAVFSLDSMLLETTL